MNNKIDFSKCDKGLHPFKEMWHSYSSLEDKIIRWCPICGAIVIDIETDGRLHPGEILPLTYPEITIKHYGDKKK